MDENRKLIRLVAVGSGSKRITLPKQWIDEKFGDSPYVFATLKPEGILIQPAEVTPVVGKHD